MKRHLRVLHAFLAFVLAAGLAPAASAKEKPAGIPLPASVISIGKENTFTQPDSDLSFLQPSDFTKELLESASEKIENPHLIKMLNESAVNKSPFSIGVRATIYLGEWPLHYSSRETVPNWQFQKVNTNFFDNRGGERHHQIHFVQEAQKTVKGALTAEVTQSEDVAKMMLLSAMEKTKLPLSFKTTIGGGTKHHQVYNIPPKQLGYLYAYVPAVRENGEVTYGEVYLVIKGMKRQLAVKNVTTKPIGAWIPIHNHLNFSFKGAK